MLCLPLYSLALLYSLAPVSGLAVSPTCDLALTWPSDNVLAHHLPGNWSFHTQVTFFNIFIVINIIIANLDMKSSIFIYWLFCLFSNSLHNRTFPS